MLSCLKNAAPFAAMVLLEFGEMGLRTLSKAAMTNGMNNLVFVVYYNTLGILILLPYFLFHTYRNKQLPPLTFNILCKFFLLGFLGQCLGQIAGYGGINYSSPTLSAALSNLSPVFTFLLAIIFRNKQPPLTFNILCRFLLLGFLGKFLSLIVGYGGMNYSSATLSAAFGNLSPVFTFLLAIIFRMEKIEIRRSSSRAKILGTIVAVSGALTVTLSGYHSSPHQLLEQQQNWVLGGLLLSIAYLSGAAWNIVQTATVKEYSDKVSLVFLYSLFGTIQCAIFSLIVEREPSAWILNPGIEMTAIVYSAIFGSVIQMTVITWCLDKKGPLFVVMFTPFGMVIQVIIGVLFLGELLHFGSVIGVIIIAVGFYTVIWGQAKEKDMVSEDVCRLESSNKNTPLLQSHNKEEP